jgi:hypothetical protein
MGVGMEIPPVNEMDFLVHNATLRQIYFNSSPTTTLLTGRVIPDILLNTSCHLQKKEEI